MSTIVLVGVPGAGKTTVGELLANSLAQEFFDSDQVIEAQAGKSVADIFTQDGEQVFRKLEHEVIAQLLKKNDAVVALGGGALGNEQTRNLVKESTVIWLVAGLAQAVDRVGMNRNRPLLLGNVRGQLAELMSAREPLYREVAKIIIDTSKLTPTEVVSKIFIELEQGRSALVKTIAVHADHTYPVVVARGILPKVNEHLVGVSKVAVIHPKSMTQVAGMLRANLPEVTSIGIEVPDAENSKTTQVLEFCWTALGEAGFTRNDLIISIGGGATTDLAGFVAATWLRGIKVLHVPTTLLAMVDAAVGGKTGINTAAGKNLVGAIHSPVAVICDLDFLTSQEPKDYVSGLAEIIKCGFIRDGKILDLIESDLAGAKSPNWEHAPEIIARAIQVKADVVGKDLRETLGTASGREILNYGHTFGHAVERQENFTWRHGDAVSVGMMFVAHLANLAGRLDINVVARHRNILAGVGLPIHYESGTFDSLLSNMRIDKKSRGDQLRFIILGSIGQPEILQAPDTALLNAAYAKLGQGETYA